MKKLKLKALKLGVTEVLSRIQLRNVSGGSGSGGSQCIPAGSSCSTVLGDDACCGTSRCIQYSGRQQCV
ncbi:hypothetical protein [Mucilaginibacter gossypiicola]|uniref:hypothetical protein n=1 Tax=Mucilaginibacter gossypiicola TaxID=551995 RepID=UPI00116002FE|nr:hypothetical protein [Mucilaginibacter gossypiicola]